MSQLFDFMMSRVSREVMLGLELMDKTTWITCLMIILRALLTSVPT